MKGMKRWISQIGFPLACLLGLVFISAGDRFLPHPLDQASEDSRTAITSALNSMFNRNLEKLPQDTRGQQKDEVVNQVTCQLWGNCEEE